MQVWKATQTTMRGTILGGIMIVWLWLYCANRQLDNRPLRPRVRPFFENIVPTDRILYSGDKAFLRSVVISRKQEGELIEAVNVVSKEATEVLASRILTGCAFEVRVLLAASQRLPS